MFGFSRKEEIKKNVEEVAPSNPVDSQEEANVILLNVPEEELLLSKINLIITYFKSSKQFNIAKNFTDKLSLIIKEHNDAVRIADGQDRSLRHELLEKCSAKFGYSKAQKALNSLNPVLTNKNQLYIDYLNALETLYFEMERKQDLDITRELASVLQDKVSIDEQITRVLAVREKFLSNINSYPENEKDQLLEQLYTIIYDLLKIHAKSNSYVLYNALSSSDKIKLNSIFVSEMNKEKSVHDFVEKLIVEACCSENHELDINVLKEYISLHAIAFTRKLNRSNRYNNNRKENVIDSAYPTVRSIYDDDSDTHTQISWQPESEVRTIRVGTPEPRFESDGISQRNTRRDYDEEMRRRLFNPTNTKAELTNREQERERRIRRIQDEERIEQELLLGLEKEKAKRARHYNPYMFGWSGVELDELYRVLRETEDEPSPRNKKRK